MRHYDKVLLDSIAREKAGLDYVCGEHDRNILNMLFADINATLHANVHYVAELDSFDLVGSGFIMVKYLDKFESEAIRAYLVPQIVSDKVDNVERLVVNLYRKFKTSRDYISTVEKPAPAHIYTRYDTAISTLKPKKLTTELLETINTPRDVYYLPLTTQMIASWKIPQFKDLLLYCAREGGITYEDIGLPNDDGLYYPSYEVIKRQLRFIVANSLKYYVSGETLNFVRKFFDMNDWELNVCAEKTIKYISKRIK